jgi:hypothetical protein
MSIQRHQQGRQMQRETIRHLCRRAQQWTDILFRWASQRPAVVLELLAAAVGLRYRLPIFTDDFGVSQ